MTSEQLISIRAAAIATLQNGDNYVDGLSPAMAEALIVMLFEFLLDLKRIADTLEEQTELMP